ncbi:MULTISPECIES: sugar ABC transporter ATP-binding protein [unclassified Microbacterium]|uniref:sugar ABC transporter ATP-binding protein n=1 Tax=unclassified Microbacterium TaxID=2609290 RepID=UPI000EAA2093|nr:MULTISPECIES: sugar ABC transporter ATP-binding protein [unclassified Microbacterium]MBT2483659.1 sugar ABC transporter ATP-binding protein [Microbacterium sp. ISL-108]RKN66661.1 sugar ABC transporter ATP-binding protein [Microbacterium sp. CGR2]
MDRLRTAEPVVVLEGITVDFPGVRALDGVDFRLFPGEVHAVMGENGAGKSTLIAVLTGTRTPAAGVVRVAGEERSFAGVAESRAAGIATVFQEAQLSPNLNVAENVMLGRERRGFFGIDWRRTWADAAEALAWLGLDDLDPRTPLSLLSPAQKQLVALARAVVDEPKVLVLDEPTSSLDQAEVATLMRVIRGLRERGVAILFISHFLEQAFAISDRMTVLRGGKRIGEYATRDLERADLISKMLGKDLDGLRALTSERKAHHYASDGQPMLRASALGRRGELDRTDIEVQRGEIVGLAGLRGSGRTELASLLSGTVRADSGEVWVEGERVDLRSPSVALRHRIAFSAESRRTLGVIGDLTARENIVLSLQALRGWTHPIGPAETAALVDAFVETLHLDPRDLDRPAKLLSGGAQQKVLLARALATRPHVLILDEPTRGIDIAAKLEVQRRISQLAADGVAIVFISSELEEVVRLSDRILVLKDREKIGELSNGPGVTVDSVVEMIAADPAPSDQV